jgi:hypothetical protein
MKENLPKYIIARAIELKLCSQDVNYFAEKYIKELFPDKIYQLRDYQKGLLKRYQNNRLNVVLSARQSGLTFCSSIYLLWSALFKSEQKIVICSQNMFNSESILNDIKHMYERLPSWLKPGVNVYNKFDISFENNSRIEVLAINEHSLRGKNVTLLYCDNAGYVDETAMRKFWAAFSPKLSTSRVILASCANDAEGLFYETYVGARRKTNHFKSFIINGSRLPKKTSEWNAELKKSIGIDNFNIEYKCRFSRRK